MPGEPQSASRSKPRSGWVVLWEAVRPHWVLTLLGVIAGLAWTAAKVSVPTLTRLAIDRGIIGRQHGALLHWALVIMAVGVVQGLAAGARRYLAFDVAYRTEAELRERLFLHLLRLPFAFHDRMQTGQLMSRAATDLQQVQQFIVMIPITIGNALIAVSVAVLLLSINAGLAVLALGTLPFINLFAKRFSSRVHPVSMNLQQELAGVAIVVEETVTGIRAVKGHLTALAKEGKNPLQLDAKAPTLPLEKYIYNETRYTMLVNSDPEEAKKLLHQAQENVNERWKLYQHMATMNFEK